MQSETREKLRPWYKSATFLPGVLNMADQDADEPGLLILYGSQVIRTQSYQRAVVWL